MVTSSYYIESAHIKYATLLISPCHTRKNRIKSFTGSYHSQNSQNEKFICTYYAYISPSNTKKVTGPSDRFWLPDHIWKLLTDFLALGWPPLLQMTVFEQSKTSSTTVLQLMMNIDALCYCSMMIFSGNKNFV